MTNTRIKGNLTEALEAAFALEDFDKAEELLTLIEALRPGELTPSLRAQRDRFRARLEAAQGRGEGVDGRFRSAAAVFREFGYVFYLAVTQLEHAEWLADRGRTQDAERLVAEAHEIFAELEARPWLERAGMLATVGREPKEERLVDLPA